MSFRLSHKVSSVFALTLISSIMFAPAANAADDTSDGGMWYFEDYSVQKAWDAGFDGDGVTIAVFDTAINPDLPVFKGSNLVVSDKSYCEDVDGKPIPTTNTKASGYNNAHHGSNVAAFITGKGDGVTAQKGVAPKAKVLYYAVNAAIEKPDETGSTVECYGDFESALGTVKKHQNIAEDALGRAMQDAMDDGADILSISLSYNRSAILEDAIIRAINEGVVVMAAVPNEGDTLQTGSLFSFNMPANANGTVGVQSMTPEGEYQGVDFGSSSPYLIDYTEITGPGARVLTMGADNWKPEIGYGTSYATPMLASFLAIVKQKYPKATGNQLIQSLLTNTGLEDHELTYINDTFGYGAASLTHMLKVDPTKFEDVNPVVRNKNLQFPTLGEIEQGMSDSTAYKLEMEAYDKQRASDLMWGDIRFGAIIGVPILIGLGFLVFFLVRSSRKKKALLQHASTIDTPVVYNAPPVTAASPVTNVPAAPTTAPARPPVASPVEPQVDPKPFVLPPPRSAQPPVQSPTGLPEKPVRPQFPFKKPE